MSSVFDLSKLKSLLSGSDVPKLKSLDLEGISQLIKDGSIKNIIIMAGAGISTSAGIPDFRSPCSGIYDNLQEFGLTHPMDVFSIDYFMENPKPFFEVARRLYSPDAKPTLTHYFVRLLSEKGLLRRHYTQNVDNLERLSGLPDEKFIEAHGTFNTGHCLTCKRLFDFDYMKDRILEKKVPMCSECNGVVKPDVVFFGENLPKKFYNNISSDFSACDLLIVLGTSLTVQPFCSLIHRVSNGVPRLYLNREYHKDESSGLFSFMMRFLVARFKKNPLKWGEDGNSTDVFVACNTDDGVLQLADLLGWKDELLNLKSSNDKTLKPPTKTTLSSEQ